MPLMWSTEPGQAAVIEFPQPDPLQELLNRQCRVSVLIVAMAKQLYAARSQWIGGGTIPWDDLTSPRKAAYMSEVEKLIKKVPGEQ